MEYPKTWDAANDKLKKLFPNSIERGRVKRKLLAIIDLDQRLEYFQDDDESVRAMLAPERASTSIHEIPSVGSRTEGINARRRVNIYTPRVESVTKLCEVLLYRNAVLIRSAPATGKTSMLQLVATHLKERYGDEVRVVHFSLQGYDPDDPASFEKLWNEQHPNTDFNSTVSPHSSPTKGAASQQQPVTVLTVDEAQKAFMHPHLKPFEKVKYIQGLEHSNLKILLVSSWGSNIVDVRDALSGAYSTPGSWDASNTVTCW